MKTHKKIKYLGMFFLIVSVIVSFMMMFSMDILPKYFIDNKGIFWLLSLGGFFIAVGSFMQNAYEKKQQEGK